MDALLLSFGVIFVAELGDKSQLMALAFAARYQLVPVVVGIVAASALVMGVSVLVGAAVGDVLPTDTVTVLAGLAFLAFAAWTVREADDGEEEAVTAPRRSGSAVLTVGGAFVLAELGDKTMLATVTLATNHGLFGTWLGSTLGMVAADALAIVLGSVLGARLPDRAIKLGAAISFFVFGAILIAEGLR